MIKISFVVVDVEPGILVGEFGDVAIPLEAVFKVDVDVDERRPRRAVAGSSRLRKDFFEALVGQLELVVEVGQWDRVLKFKQLDNKLSG